MYVFLTAIVILIVASLLLWRKRLNSDEDAATDEDSSVARAKKSPYHAVSVRIGESACLAAKTIEGKRYLAREAPQLPLAECSAAENCRCRFIHHEDRRSGKDRRSPFAPGNVGSGTATIQQERRQGTDRRQSGGDAG